MTSLQTTEDGFVFTAGRRVVRVAAPSRVVNTFETRSPGTSAMLLPDRRTLLYLAMSGDESPGDCVPNRSTFQLFDTIDGGRPRVGGTFPRGGGGFAMYRLRVGDDGKIRALYYVMNRDEYEEVTVDPRTLRASVRPVEEEDVDGGERSSGPLVDQGGVVVRRLERRNGLAVQGARGRTKARVLLDTYPVRAPLSDDGRYLAIVTFSEENVEYHNGWDARLDVVDLQTGSHTTPHGEGSAVSAVRGRTNIACSLVVHDPDSTLNVRSEPRARAEVAGTVPHGAIVDVQETRGMWRRIESPVAGWVWGPSLRRTCSVE